MTKRQAIATLLGVLAVGFIAAWAAQKPAASQDGIAVYFSPDGSCTAAIVQEINDARKAILVQAYSFTSKPLAEAMMRAHKRGVEVWVVLDSSQRTSKYSSATFFRNQGMDVYIDSKHAIAHNKVMLIDNRVIITGSFNFTKAAEERNAENLLIIKEKIQLVRAYWHNFDKHLDHSVEYSSPDEDENGDPAKAPRAKGLPEILEVQVLKRYMTSRSHAAFDIRFVNTSDSYLGVFSIRIELYDANDRYLGSAQAMATHLQPGQAKIEDVIFLDTNVDDIAKWTVSLSGVVGESGLRIDKQFELRESAP